MIKILVLAAVFVLAFLAVSVFSGGEGFTWLGEVTGVSFFRTLGEKADAIKERVNGMSKSLDDMNRDKVKKFKESVR
jgi:hypothetical protein